MPKVAQKQIDLQKEWEERIDRAKKVQASWKRLFHVDLAREYLDGKQNPGIPEADWITVNNVYSHLKAQLPALYDADPYFYVKLRRSFNPNPMMIALYESKGKIRQSYLNYLKDELKLKEKARVSIQDGHFEYGVAKVHYHADLKENPDAGKQIQTESEQPMIDDKGNPVIEPDTIPINDRYMITRIHPDDFLWDEDAGPLEDTWHWVGQRIREPWEEAKKNPRYNKQALNLMATRGDNEEKTEDDKRREERKKGGDVKGRPSKIRKAPKKEPDMLVAWEIYDLRHNTWLIVAENGEILLKDVADVPKGTEGHPFSILRFTLRDDSPYPIPPISPGLEPSKEYNRARSDIQKHRKRFNRKYVTSRQAFGDDESELSKLESGDDGTIIVVNGDATTAVAPVKDAQLDQMRYQELGFLRNEMIELFGGATTESRGIAGADSATQAGILDKRLDIKEGDAKSMVMDFVTTIAKKLDQLVQTHISQDEAVRITGPQGEFWEMVRAADYQEIDGEFEYSVNVGASLPRMPQIERASWMAFLTLLQGFPHLLLSKRLFKKMAEMHHIEDEAMLDEVYQIGQQIMGGQLPMPGQQGSQPGVGEDRPVSAMGGMAGGVQSMNQPGGGNIQQ